MEIQLWGWAATLAVGFSLGLLGSGGSVLTVPILVYLFGIRASQATGYSLCIVGTTSVVGALAYARCGLVKFSTAGLLAVPSFIAVYGTRRVLLPAMPDPVIIGPVLLIGRDRALMLLFAALMLVVAWVSLRQRAPLGLANTAKAKWHLLPVYGLAVGFLAGLLGAGGGFLIIPALLWLARLRMPQAIGTSLVIIAAQSMLGFLGAVQTDPTFDWRLLGVLVGIAVVGMILGFMMSAHLQADQLRTVFAWFVLLVGLGILAKELFA